MHPSNLKSNLNKIAALSLPLIFWGMSPAVDPVTRIVESDPAQKNVVLLLFDDLRHDPFSFTGGPVPTPNIDKLAEEGIWFSSAITTTGLCSPSRAALFTGRWGHRTGLDDNINLWHSKNPGLSLEHTTLLEWASSQGYRVGYYGKWHLGPEGPEKRGVVHTSGGKIGGGGRKAYVPLRDPETIQKYYELEEQAKEKALYYKTLNGSYEQTGLKTKTDDGIDFINSASQTDSSFFLTISFNQPHPAYRVPEPYASMFDPQSLNLPVSIDDDMTEKPLTQTQVLWPWHDVGHMTDTDWKRATAYFYGAVAMIDRAVGELIEVLKNNGKLENTMIVVVGDQGSMIGEHGLYDKGPYCYDELVRIPILIKIPGKQARVINRQVSILDLNETLVEWMGIEPSQENIDSRSLFPLIDHGDGGWQTEDLAFYHYEWYNGSWFGIRTIRTPRWKYCWNPTDMDELYHLENDPVEDHNLIDNSAYSEKLAELQLKLLKHLQTTEDPLFEWLAEELGYKEQ